jgi:hypothetical protein
MLQKLKVYSINGELLFMVRKIVKKVDFQTINFKLRRESHLLCVCLQQILITIQCIKEQ